MTPKILALDLVLTLFAALTAWAIGTHGYVGFFQTLLATPAGMQVLADIVIACTLVLIWMWDDARARALPIWPYALLTLVLGSIGPLAYLIHRELRATAARRVTA